MASEPEEDHFLRLGLPRSFFIEPSELEAAYRRASLQVHPDRSLGTPHGKQFALEEMARLNRAYAVLRDQRLRARHLLQLYGVPSVELGTSVAPEFLVGVMELQEEIAEAKFEKKTDRIDELTVKVHGLLASVRAEVERGMLQLQQGNRSGISALLSKLASVYFYDRLLNELDTEDD